MTLKEYIDNLNDFATENPEALKMDVVYSKDDEGNGFHHVHHTPIKGNFEDDFFIDSQIFLKIFQGEDIFLSSYGHGIGHENNTVHTAQHQSAGRIVFYLAGDGVQLNFNVITVDDSDIERQEIKKQGPVPMGLDSDHLGIDTLGEFFIDIFQIGRLASPAGTVIDDFNLDFLIFQIYKCHRK